MRASAQLAGPVAEAHDTNGVAVLLLEEIHRAVQRDVERGVVGTDPRALLHYVLAELLAQRLVEQVRGRMVPRDLPPARRVDRCPGTVADADLTGDDRSEVRDHTVRGFL